MTGQITELGTMGEKREKDTSRDIVSRYYLTHAPGFSILPESRSLPSGLA